MAARVCAPAAYMAAYVGLKIWYHSVNFWLLTSAMSRYAYRMPHSRPKSAPKTQRRKTARTQLPSVECQLWSLDAKHSAAHDVTMRDIGAGGTLVSAPVAMPVGHSVLCNFTLPAGGKHSLRGRVVRCVAHKDGGRFDVAVEFSSTQASEEELMRWVLSWIGLQSKVLMGVPRAHKHV